MSSVDKSTIEGVQQNVSTLKKCFDVVGKPIIRENYVGEGLQQQVMSVNHESAFSGHEGAKKIEVKILLHFSWPGLCQNFIRFCRSCDMSQRTIKKGIVKKVPLGSMKSLLKRLCQDGTEP